ncbi:MAG: arsenite methyltransferase [Nitrospirae bacterium]|nr:arsenite methyltransferase [Nitrospirota bacterium]
MTRYERSDQSAEGCCGGPAPEGVSACCVKDAQAKSIGESGCGCDGSTAKASDGETACCRSDSPALEETKESNAHELKHDEIRQAVRTQYSRVAISNGCGCAPDDSGCCGSKSGDAKSLSHAIGYSAAETESVPEGANMGLGCGNPQAIASLRAGEIVVDLGSGGGFDCFLAARQVGANGHVIGIDMTPDMVSKARSNANKGEYQNVEFRLGEIENMPIADATANVIISNCVINLSPDKHRVFSESYRILKPGGRLAIADIVAFAELPEEIRKDMALFTGCMAGASLVREIEEMLRSIGFQQIRVSPNDESKSFISGWALGVAITDYVVSATIEAVKPAS